MSLLFKGVGAGTHWHMHDATNLGFTAHARSTIPHSVNMMMLHIAGATPLSPYISLTRSYGVACSYAGVGASSLATPTTPGYVYIIDIPDPLPSDVQLFDPVKEIAINIPSPPSIIPYQHEGRPEYLLGIIDRPNFGHHLQSYRLSSGGLVSIQVDTPSQHLLTLVHTLRDAELVAYDSIPARYVVRRISVP